jgi:hypothetical protein
MEHKDCNITYKMLSYISSYVKQTQNNLVLLFLCKPKKALRPQAEAGAGCKPVSSHYIQYG